MQHVLIVTDIFGQCNGLSHLLKALAVPAQQLIIVDPYFGKPQAFPSEREAYTAFAAQCGHEQYVKLVAAQLSALTFPIRLALGFSAGATALWRAAANEQSAIQHAVLFYPGQIYKYLDLQPKTSVKVIFGESEPHFSVTDLCVSLLQKQLVSTVVTPYKHGFMNPASPAFNAQGFANFVAELTAAK